jgi:syntaxin 16
VQASRNTNVDIDQRTNELTQIASSISELAELFRDLGNMVVEQGTVLDSVEYNVQQTAAHAKGAVEELNVATR